jgi:hypothetical protein
MCGAFPAHLAMTPKRPDIIIASGDSSSPGDIALVELTVPLEDNATTAFDRKHASYAELQSQLESDGWSVLLVTVEIGSRGIMGTKSLSGTISELRRGDFITKHLVSRSSLAELSLRCSRIALACSYWIWQSRHSAAIPPNMVPLK